MQKTFVGLFMEFVGSNKNTKYPCLHSPHTSKKLFRLQRVPANGAFIVLLEYGALEVLTLLYLP